MTDRELLELAAKAAGLSRVDTFVEEWNPLIDDGDALRLAVICGIGVGFDMQNEEILSYEPSPGRGYHVEDAHEVDRFAATRRAIVRAAAEIGWGMK